MSKAKKQRPPLHLGSLKGAGEIIVAGYLSLLPKDPSSHPHAPCCGVEGLGLSGWNVGCGVWGVGCGVWGVGCGVWGVGCGVWGVGCGVWGVGCGVWGVGCGVWGVGCGVWGVGCGVWGVGLGLTRTWRLGLGFGACCKFVVGRKEA